MFGFNTNKILQLVGDVHHNVSGCHLFITQGSQGVLQGLNGQQNIGQFIRLKIRHSDEECRTVDEECRTVET